MVVESAELCVVGVATEKCVVASARICVVDLATGLCSWFFVRYLEFVSVSVDLSVIIREINISVVDYISYCLGWCVIIICS